MVITSFGVAKSEDELRELCDCTIFGTGAIELVQAARALGFANSRKYSLASDDLKDFTNQGFFPIVYVVLSLVSLLPNVHALVVTSVSDTEITVIDPTRGFRRLSLLSFNEMWSPMKNLAVVVRK